MRYLSILTLLALAGQLLAADAPSTDTRPLVKIGISAPLSGEMAHFGETIVAWQKNVMAQVASTHTHLRYQVFVEDNQFQPRLAILSAKRLVELNGAQVLFSYGSPPGAAIAPYANEKKIPHIAVAYNPAAISGEYNVSMSPPIEDFLPPFFELLKKKNLSRLAVIYVRNATWQPIFDKLVAQAPANGAQIVYQQTYNPGERDFRLGIQQIPQDKVDAIVLLAWAPEVNILAERLREQGVKKQLLSLGGSLIFSDRPKSMNGAMDVFLPSMVDIDNINQAYTGKPTHSANGANACDQLTLTIAIHERYYEDHEKIIPPDEFMKQLRATKDFPSVFGPISCLPSGYFSFTFQAYLIKDGKLKKLD